ncbi:Fc.00g054780.m01.CDS01 [Cosmosporella sp. VM-42]
MVTGASCGIVQVSPYYWLDEIPKLIDAALKISETGKIEILIHKYVLVYSTTHRKDRIWNSTAQGNEPNLADTIENFYTRHFDANVKGPIFLTKAVDAWICTFGQRWPI